MIDVEKNEFYYETREDKNIIETIKRRINYWYGGKLISSFFSLYM